MVFVEKTLDQMLSDIKFINPILLSENDIFRNNLSKNSCYFFRDKDSIREYNCSVTNSLENYLGCFLGLPPEKVGEEVECCTILELINNALDWGNGITETKYHSSPRGVVIDIIQNKLWNYKKIINNFKCSLSISTRCSNGGHGLKSAKESYMPISYNNNSTIIMLKK